jgi:hypothetical protein
LRKRTSDQIMSDRSDSVADLPDRPLHLTGFFKSPSQSAIYRPPRVNFCDEAIDLWENAPIDDREKWHSLHPPPISLSSIFSNFFSPPHRDSDPTALSDSQPAESRGIPTRGFWINPLSRVNPVRVNHTIWVSLALPLIQSKLSP